MRPETPRQTMQQILRPLLPTVRDFVTAASPEFAMATATEIVDIGVCSESKPRVTVRLDSGQIIEIGEAQARRFSVEPWEMVRWLKARLPMRS